MRPTSLVCGGCGWAAPEDDPYPFRCPNQGTDDTDHVVARVLDTGRVSWPAGDEPNPFVRYRTLFHSYHLAAAHGMADAEYVELVERLDKEVAAVDGRGFAATPLIPAAELGHRLGFTPRGGLWVKDETGNVSGSHKARHLMGLLVHLEVVDALGLDREAWSGQAPRVRQLAIASCGNAALAAGVVARAGGRPLDVFVPPWADPGVVARLQDVGAHVTVCRRTPGLAGDPTYVRLRQAIGDGSLPFTCQGTENGLSIEGGQTLPYEIASAPAGGTLDRLFVQVGGGALASAVIRGMEEARRLGAIDRVPRIHAVQTRGGHPLERAYHLVVDRIRAGLEDGEPAPENQEGLADLLRARIGADAVRRGLAHATANRSRYMWPWEDEPRSVAHGILDDETYDWLAVVKGMVATGGYPVVVDETTLQEANEVGRTLTGIDVDHTGTAALAGVIDGRRRGGIGPQERVAVLFTGARR